MKKFLKFLPLIVLLCALVCVFVACDEEPPVTPETAVVDGQGIAYRLNADKTAYTVIGFSSQSASEVVIPEKIKSKPVVSIQTGAFRGDDKITTVSISSAVTVINEGAFSGCANLEKVWFGAGSDITTIGVSAFSDCVSLSVISLPNGLVTLSESAFEGCSALSNMVIPASIQTLSDFAFRDCIAMEKVEFNEGSTLTEIGEEAFCGCMSLSSVTLPDGLTDIDKSAFFGCRALTNVQLPDTLVNIQKYAFYGCEVLTEITIPATVEKIGISAFNNCQKLRKVNFEDGSIITQIEAHTFENCLELLSFTLPDSVTDIDEKAFFNCESLKTVTFGEQSALQTVNSQVFVGCDAIEEINLPKSLVTIKESAFEACESLTTVTVPDESALVDIGERVFYDCDNLTTVTFGDLGSLREIGANVFYDCDRLMTVDFGAYSTLKKIGQKAFFDCDALFSFTVPIDVTEIGANAFANCFRLVEVNDLSITLNIEKGSSSDGGVATYAKDVAHDVEHESKISVDDEGYVTYTNGSNVSLVGYIGDQIELIVPLEITEINRYAFYKNTFVKTVVFEVGTRLNSILPSAFESCTALKGFEIPVEVLEIGQNAFKDCKAVNAIYYDARNCADLSEDTNAFFSVGTSTSGVNLMIGPNAVNLPDYAFSSSGTLPRIKTVEFLGTNLESIGNYAFRNNRYVTNLTLPASLRTMGESAFENTAITYLTFEEGCWLYTIPKKAFYNCTKLISVDFSEESYVADINTQAFENCTSLRGISFGESSGLMVIGASAFKNCINMTSFELVSSAHMIQDDAFYNCYRLTEVIDPSDHLDITAGSEENGGIAKYALVVHDGPESVVETDDDGYVILSDGDKKVLVNYVGNSTELIVPAIVTDVNTFALRDRSTLTSVKFDTDSALTVLGDKVFLNCTKLKTVEIPENTVEVGEGILNGCTALDTVYYNAVDCTGIVEETVVFNGTGDNGFKLIVGNTVEVIPAYLCRATEEKYDFKVVGVEFAENSKCKTVGDYAFAEEDAIPSLIIPDSVVSIGNYAFKDCTGIENLSFGEGSALKLIGTKAFENCVSITDLSLPGKVNSISADAFDGLSKVLLSIKVADENTTYHAQGNCLIKTSDNTLMVGCRNSTIPDYIVTVADGAFKNCDELKKIVIPESVKSIGAEAFYNCISVTEITIQGNNLESIGHNAFVYCLRVQKITLPVSIRSIGSHAFLYCTGMEKISYTGTSQEWKMISFGEKWNYRVPATKIGCSDGNVEL